MAPRDRQSDPRYRPREDLFLDAPHVHYSDEEEEEEEEEEPTLDPTEEEEEQNHKRLLEELKEALEANHWDLSLWRLVSRVMDYAYDIIPGIGVNPPTTLVKNETVETNTMLKTNLLYDLVVNFPRLPPTPEVWEAFLIQTTGDCYCPPSTCSPPSREWVRPCLAHRAAAAAAKASKNGRDAAWTVMPCEPPPPPPPVPLPALSPLEINSFVSFSAIMAGFAFHFSQVAVESARLALCPALPPGHGSTQVPTADCVRVAGHAAAVATAVTELSASAATALFEAAWYSPDLCDSFSPSTSPSSSPASSS